MRHIARPRGALALSACLVLFTAACGSSREPEDAAAPFRAQARTVVPPSMKVIASEPGDCVELAEPPSCVLFKIVGAKPEDARARDLSEFAEANGWDWDWEKLAGATWINLRRGDYRAWVAIRSDATASPCRRGADSPTCADDLQIIRVG